ncbi:putative DNA breaking-rejoining enzyme, partial [Lyophyllum shimeji]
ALAKFDPVFHTSRASANLKFFHVSGGCEYASCHIPWTKTTGRKGATITVTDNGELLSPYLALKHHLHANAAVPADAPLFAFESGDTASGWAPLTREWFLERCNAVWSAAGLTRVSGHSFRIGGATGAPFAWYPAGHRAGPRSVAVAGFSALLAEGGGHSPHVLVQGCAHVATQWNGFGYYIIYLQVHSCAPRFYNSLRYGPAWVGESVFTTVVGWWLLLLFVLPRLHPTWVWHEHRELRWLKTKRPALPWAPVRPPLPSARLSSGPAFVPVNGCMLGSLSIRSVLSLISLTLPLNILFRNSFSLRSTPWHPRLARSTYRAGLLRFTNLKFFCVTDGCEYASFYVSWMKTTGHRGTTITVTDNGELLSPYLALKHHLHANTAVPANAPLFAFESGDTASGWPPLTHKWFLERCNTVWSAAGLTHVSGHSFRIGGVTEFLLRGTPPDIVRVLGRWQSQAFLLYQRKVEAILPQFLSGALRSSRLAQLRNSMEMFPPRVLLQLP